MAAPVPVAGIMIAVGFESVVVFVILPPTRMMKLTVPRSTPASSTMNVAVTLPPQAIDASTAKVNSLEAPGPIGLRAP